MDCVDRFWLFLFFICLHCAGNQVNVMCGEGADTLRSPLVFKLEVGKI